MRNEIACSVYHGLCWDLRRYRHLSMASAINSELPRQSKINCVRWILLSMVPISAFYTCKVTQRLISPQKLGFTLKENLQFSSAKCQLKISQQWKTSPFRLCRYWGKNSSASIFVKPETSLKFEGEKMPSLKLSAT